VRLRVRRGAHAADITAYDLLEQRFVARGTIAVPLRRSRRAGREIWYVSDYQRLDRARKDSRSPKSHRLGALIEDNWRLRGTADAIARIPTTRFTQESFVCGL